jgi:hypothetical protein
MDTSIHQKADSIEVNSNLTYFTKEYLLTQDHPQFLAFENDHFMLPINISNQMAISIPKSPFGSIYKKSTFDASSWESLQVALEKELRSRNVTEIHLKHPSPIYEEIVKIDRLNDFSVLFQDINQHIALDEQWESRIHKMQKRKLHALQNDDFEFKLMSHSDLNTAYQFLTVCRQTQGLQVNISLESLQQLFQKIPKSYECFGVFREQRLSALCIAVRVTKDIAYYYLPATSPMFRSQSPMVLLIAGMVEYYREKGLKYLDLGVSSINGRPQETLRLFKERMGATETLKPSLAKNI